MSTEELASSAIPAAQKSSWTQFIKDLARAGTADLSSLSAPTFILSPTSIVEFPSYWCENWRTFGSINQGGNAVSEQERMLMVLEWFLGTFSGQFTAREQATGSEKKPLNAFLGEQFIGSWNAGETTLVAEQVSHHPPITGYHLENASQGISFEGSCAQKTSFSGRAITVKQVGHGLLRVVLPPTSGSAEANVETYLITLPKLTVEGIFFGKPYVELLESSWIVAQSGLMVKLDYSGKGYFSGKAHSFTATMTQSPSPTPLYTIAGQWSSVSTYTSIPTSSTSPKFINRPAAAVGATFVDFGKIVKEPIEVKEVKEQGEFESRKVWETVAQGIRSGDFAKAGEAKTGIEVAERQRRKDELSAGTPFDTRLFTTLSQDPQYRQLAAMCKHKPEEEDSYKVIRR